MLAGRFQVFGRIQSALPRYHVHNKIQEVRPLAIAADMAQITRPRIQATRAADRVHSTGWRLIRPISARYPGVLSLRVSERILVSRLESRSRQPFEGPSGRDRRNISIAC